MNRIIVLIALLFSIVGCSGGNAGSSSGSGGADPGPTTTEDNTEGTTNIGSGSYTGNIEFPSLNNSTPITIEINNDSNVTVTSNEAGTATGTATAESFSASGTMSFNLTSQICSGFATVQGTGSDDTLNGTVSVLSASCVEDDVTTTIPLDGTFSASL